MITLPLDHFDPPKLFEYLKYRWIEPVPGGLRLTEQGQQTLGTLARARKTELRVDALNRRRIKAYHRLFTPCRECSTWCVYGDCDETITEVRRRRRHRRRRRIEILVERAGLQDLLYPEREDENDLYPDSYSAETLETRHGTILVLRHGRLVDANHDACTFVVQCQDRIFLGEGCGDVSGAESLQLDRIEAQSSPWLELAGEEHVASFETFLEFALGHLLAGTIPGPDHGQPLED